MQDQYGNYVVQFILEKGLPQDKSDIIQQIQGQILHLSKHKFASNGELRVFAACPFTPFFLNAKRTVIEKCIINANQSELQLTASEVLAPRVDGPTGVISMLKHEVCSIEKSVSTLQRWLSAII